jgi:hypothetical protein
LACFTVYFAISLQRSILLHTHVRWRPLVFNLSLKRFFSLNLPHYLQYDLFFAIWPEYFVSLSIHGVKFLKFQSVASCNNIYYAKYCANKNTLQWNLICCNKKQKEMLPLWSTHDSRRQYYILYRRSMH